MAKRHKIKTTFTILALIFTMLCMNTNVIAEPAGPVVHFQEITEETLYPDSMALHETEEYQSLLNAIETGDYAIFDSFDELCMYVREFKRSYGIKTFKYKLIETIEEYNENSTVTTVWYLDDGRVAIHPVMQIDEENTPSNALEVVEGWLEESDIYEGMPQKEAVWEITDIICDHTCYDYIGMRIGDYNKYWTDVVNKGTTVCNGYSELFMILSLMCGIPCYMVDGTIYSNDEWHGWNVIEINDIQYTVDTCFYDSGCSNCILVIGEMEDRYTEHCRCTLDSFEVLDYLQEDYSRELLSPPPTQE